MFRIYRSISFFLMAFLFVNVGGFAQEDTTSNWKLSKDKNGIRIHTRNVEGSKYKEYKSTIMVDASPQQLVEVLLDVEGYVDWMAYVKEARLLEAEGERKFYVYSEVKVPWPFDNRDEVTLSEVIKDPDTDFIEIVITIEPDYLPEKKGVVRMPSGKGYWSFTPLDNGMTEVFHQFGGDPGGKIPAWIVNMFLVDGPYNTLLGLQERLSKSDK